MGLGRMERIFIGEIGRLNEMLQIGENHGKVQVREK